MADKSGKTYLPEGSCFNTVFGREGPQLRAKTNASSIIGARVVALRNYMVVDGDGKRSPARPRGLEPNNEPPDGDLPTIICTHHGAGHFPNPKTWYMGSWDIFPRAELQRPDPLVVARFCGTAVRKACFVDARWGAYEDPIDFGVNEALVAGIEDCVAGMRLLDETSPPPLMASQLVEETAAVSGVVFAYLRSNTDLPSVFVDIA